MAEMSENAGHVETTLTSPAYMKSNDRNVNVSTQMLKKWATWLCLFESSYVCLWETSNISYATAYVEPTPLHEVSPMSLSGVSSLKGDCRRRPSAVVVPCYIISFLHPQKKATHMGPCQKKIVVPTYSGNLQLVRVRRKRHNRYTLVPQSR